jgi:hypothetical protein
MVVVFLVTTLTFNLFDASVHVTHASAPRPELDHAQLAARAPDPRSPDTTARFRSTPSAPPPVAREPVAIQSNAESASAQVDAPAIADPSTFGSEAYEPIYSN